MLDKKRSMWFPFEMEEDCKEETSWEMYEIVIFPALSEISDLDSIGSFKEVRLSEVFDWTQKIYFSQMKNFIIY